MKKLVPYLLICFLHLSCVKDKVTVIEPPLSITVPIKIDQVINDSTIVLTWPKYYGDGFRRYVVMRQASYYKNGKFDNYYESIDSSTDVNYVSFTEKKMPYARDLVYYILVENAVQANSKISFVYYVRPNSLFYGIPTDVLINRTQKLIYITEEKTISAYDYTTGRQQARDSFPASIGYCSVGDFNGSTELYVPVNDGWVQIRDAATLQLKDKIYVAGLNVGSVTSYNGKLYISTTDATNGIYNYIKVYDRGSKTLIGLTGYYANSRLVPLESTSIEMIDMPVNPGPQICYYYQFTPNGTLLSKNQYVQGPTGYTFSPNILRSFPDGSKFITNTMGIILTKAMTVDRLIRPNASYSDYAFNNDGSVIYAGSLSQKQIDAIGYPNGNIITSYPTSFYPYKMFREGNSLICVGKSVISQQKTYVLIEKINL